MRFEEGLVSVVMPAFNAEATIAESIQSVMAQTYPKWELLVVDDGSTDSTAAVARGYCQQDSRIRLFSKENGGSASARNRGISEAAGQYIALLDSDDLWEPCFIDEQLRFMKEKGALCVYSSYKRIDKDSKECLRPLACKPRVTHKDMLTRNYIGCLTGLYDCSAKGKVYLHEELKFREDYAYWLDVVKLAGAAYGNPKVLASYRVAQNSKTGKKKNLVKIQFLFYKKHLKLSLASSLINTLRWGLAGIINFSR